MDAQTQAGTQRERRWVWCNLMHSPIEVGSPISIFVERSATPLTDFVAYRLFHEGSTVSGLFFTSRFVLGRLLIS